MKKCIILSFLTLLCSCSHVDEEIIGYNDKGATIIRRCKSWGTMERHKAFGSSCRIEERDFGKIIKK